MNVPINAKRLRASLPDVVERVRKGARFTVIYRSRPAFQIVPINDGDSDSNAQPNTSTDERLCEALFYVGEEYWARGQPEVARDYFAALVNIRVLFFVEHGIALAEIARLR